MTRHTRLLSFLMVFALLAAGCGNGGDADPSPTAAASPDEDDTGGTPTPIVEETVGLTGGESANFHDEEDASDEQSLEVELDDNYFEPTIITGRAGQELTLELFNEGGNIHNFSLTEQEISEDLQEGGNQEVQVRFPDSGALTFFCRYHAELGMRGELKVGSGDGED